MAADPRDPSRSLFDRWRALAPGEGAPRRSEPPRALSEPPPPLDPSALFAAIEGEVTATAPAAAAFLAPIREALKQPADARDPEALALAFAQLDDVLEALLLVPARARAEG